MDYLTTSKLTKELLEKSRTPRELSEFVVSYIAEAELDKKERHAAFLKKGKYKEFIDELVPLSLFCELYYPNDDVGINLIVGNQAFDAVVKRGEEVISKIELTIPHDGAKRAEEFRQVVNKGFSDRTFYVPGEDLENLRPIILSTCRKKAAKDYRNCLLVICVEYITPLEVHEGFYRSKVQSIYEDIQGMSFNAKRVFLLETHQKKLHEI